MNKENIKIASRDLLGLKNFVPNEYARKPRTLDQVDRFKATKLRQILLYTGLVVFQNTLNKDQYTHFVCLSVAIRILASETLNELSRVCTGIANLLCANVSYSVWRKTCFVQCTQFDTSPILCGIIWSRRQL